MIHGSSFGMGGVGAQFDGVADGAGEAPTWMIHGFGCGELLMYLCLFSSVWFIERCLALKNGVGETMSSVLQWWS